MNNVHQRGSGNVVAQWRGWAVRAGRGSRFESTLGLHAAVLLNE